MIKILHLVSTFQIKTDTKWLVRLLAAIDRDRFAPAVAAFYDDGPARQQFEHLGIDCHVFAVRSAVRSGGVTRSLRLIKSLRPQIVHTHLLRADLFGGAAARLARTPVVSTVYAHGQYRRQKKRILIDGLLDRITSRLADRFVAVCSAIKEDLVQRVGVPENRISVIHTGMDRLDIDAGQIAATVSRYHLPRDRPIVIVPARLSYEKGVDCLLRAVRVMVDRGRSACFLVAGTGPQERVLRDLCRKLDLGEHVRFMGFVEDIEALLAASDLVVLPSYSEGLPNAALEAFAVGTPLVASAVGGLVDLAQYEPSPLILARPNDPNDLADNILELLSNDQLAAALSDAGRTIIEKGLNTRQVAKRYERLYLELSPDHG